MQASKQDFEKIAKVFREQVDLNDEYGPTANPDEMLADLASDISDILEGSNPLFSRDQFLRACGVRN